MMKINRVYDPEMEYLGFGVTTNKHYYKALREGRIFSIDQRRNISNLNMQNAEVSIWLEAQSASG